MFESSLPRHREDNMEVKSCLLPVKYEGEFARLAVDTRKYPLLGAWVIQKMRRCFITSLVAILGHAAKGAAESAQHETASFCIILISGVIMAEDIQSDNEQHSQLQKTGMRLED